MEIHVGLTPVGTKTAVALGYFDGMHRGHKEIMKQTVAYAKRMALRPTVFTFDFSGGRPGDKGHGDLFSKEEKYKEIEKLGVDLIVEVGFREIRNMTGKEFIEKVLGHGCLNAAVVCCGEDFRFGKGRGGDVDAMERLAGPRGIRVNIVPFVTDDGVISTTRIKRLIAAGDIPTAARLLGRPYCIDLPTVKKGIGVGINFSSASQQLDERLELPKFGVYQSRAKVSGRWKDAVTYIGTRPTRPSGEGVFADTNILSLEGKPYEGKSLTVELLRLMRPEERFEGLGELKDAIYSDIERVKLLI